MSEQELSDKIFDYTIHNKTKELNLLLAKQVRKNGRDYVKNIVDQFREAPEANEIYHVRALERACDLNHSEIAATLLFYGADPNIVDENGIFPLLQTSWRHSYETAKVLLKYGARVDLSTEGYYNMTVLSDSALRKFDDMVELFLKHGANPNHADAFGNTSLHNALIWEDVAWWSPNGNGKIIKILIQHKAEIDRENAEGKTPLYIAIEKKMLPEATMLMKLGANPDHVSDCPEIPTPRYLDHDFVNRIEIIKYRFFDYLRFRE